MKIADVRKNAFAMPLNNPAYPRPPYKFYNREFIVISYRTDPELLRPCVPDPREPLADTGSYEVPRRPQSPRLAHYHEAATVTPGSFISRRKKVIPRCLGASGSVRARRIM